MLADFLILLIHMLLNNSIQNIDVIVKILLEKVCRSSLGDNLQSVASALGIIRMYRQLLYRLQHSDEFPHECHGWQDGPVT